MGNTTGGGTKDGAREQEAGGRQGRWISMWSQDALRANASRSIGSPHPAAISRPSASTAVRERERASNSSGSVSRLEGGSLVKCSVAMAVVKSDLSRG